MAPRIPAVPLFLALLLSVCLAACGSSRDADSGADAGERVRLAVSQKTEYYSVVGDTHDEIFANIERYGPSDEEGRRGSGLTSAHWSYTWRGETARGECRVDDMTITLDLVVTLPRHEQGERLDPLIQERWRELADSVAKHEQRHVDIYLEGAEQMKQRMIALPALDGCSLLQAEIERTWEAKQAEIGAAQSGFHDEEDVRIALKRQPMEAQLQANRAQLTTISGDIRARDGEITRLKNEVAAAEVELDGLRARITAIEAQYPAGAPQGVFTQYQTLRGQYNRLVESYNGLVRQYNGAIDRRATLSADYERLLALTNEIVEELNWTR